VNKRKIFCANVYSNRRVSLDSAEYVLFKRKMSVSVDSVVHAHVLHVYICILSLI
jgi:hypothetical protein